MAIRNLDYLTSLTDEQYRHIGEIIYRFSLLDFQLVEILGLILGLNKKQRRLGYVNSDFKGKLAILKLAGSKWILDSILRQRINDLVKFAYRLEDRRNLYAHTIFGRISDQPEATKIVHMRTGEQRHIPATEPWDGPSAALERDAYHEANAAAATIIVILGREKDNPRFVKLELRQLDPPSPKMP